MPKRITETQRQTVLRMLARDVDRETIAASVGVTPGQVSAIVAHVKMGTYELPADVEESQENVPEERERTRNLLRQLYDLEGSPAAQTWLAPILLGTDAESNNPLQIFPSDMHGPVNVAQRVADTFARVYPRIGVQQHAVLRLAVLDVMADEAIVPEDADSWGRDLRRSGTYSTSFYPTRITRIIPTAGLRRTWPHIFQRYLSSTRFAPTDKSLPGRR